MRSPTCGAGSTKSGLGLMTGTRSGSSLASLLRNRLQLKRFLRGRRDSLSNVCGIDAMVLMALALADPQTFGRQVFPGMGINLSPRVLYQQW